MRLPPLANNTNLHHISHRFRVIVKSVKLSN